MSMFRASPFVLLFALCVPACNGATPTVDPPRPPSASLPSAPTSTPPSPAPALEPVEVADLPPPRPQTPQLPEPLPVDGWQDASHAGPDDSVPFPAPVVVVVHGNFDRPEWECDLWKKVAGFHGWVLCPRGVRTPAATVAEDRWTYRGGATAVSKEIHAGLQALEERYPGLVRREQMVYAGFSLGAILATDIVTGADGLFPVVFLIEGGLTQAQGRWGALKKAGVVAVGLAMSAADGRKEALALIPRLEREGFATVFVDMKGAGHNYSPDFDTTGRAALADLLGRISADPP